MGRKIRYTGRKRNPFELATSRGTVEVTPDAIMDVHPLLALELLRGEDAEFEPATAAEYREENP